MGLHLNKRYRSVLLSCYYMILTLIVNGLFPGKCGMFGEMSLYEELFGRVSCWSQERAFRIAVLINLILSFGSVTNGSA